MRGYPLLQLLLVGCLFAAAGFPVWKLTHTAPPSAVGPGVPSPASPVPAAGETSLEIAVIFAPAPGDFRLSYLGRTVLEGRGPQAEFQGKAKVILPKEGGDFLLEAHWPGATSPAAAHVTINSTERSVWSGKDGSMVELVTVTP